MLWALLAYVAAGLICGALGDGLSKSLHDSLKDSHRLWSLGLFVAALTLEPEGDPAPALAAGLGLGALIGMAQWLWNLLARHPERAHAFVHPVTYGEQMALGALAAGCAFARAETPRVRRAAAVVGALCAAALLLSGTRAALIALAVGAFAAAALEPRLRRAAAVAAVLGTLGATADEALRYGRAHLGAELAVSAATPQGTRYALWGAAWRMFRDHPWTGVGPGHYLTEFPRYVHVVLDGQSAWASAHNLFLQQLAERGLLGETVLLALLGLLLIRAWRAARARGDAAALWAAAAVPAFLVMNLTETAWQTEQLATFFLLIWALGAAPRASSPQTKPI